MSGEHKAYTFINYRVLVMDRGEVKEYASPDTLLADSSSMFAALARDAKVVPNGAE